VDIAPPEKWPGERTGKNVESNNRAPVGSGLSVAAVHIDRSLSRRYSFGRAVGVSARQCFVIARGQDYSFLLHLLTDRGWNTAIADNTLERHQTVSCELRGFNPAEAS
jgi:hypothetical protein